MGMQKVKLSPFLAAACLRATVERFLARVPES
jgi:hypothetical protein